MKENDISFFEFLFFYNVNLNVEDCDGNSVLNVVLLKVIVIDYIWSLFKVGVDFFYSGKDGLNVY